MPYDPTKDPFASHSSGSSTTGRRGAEITPDDDNDLATYAKALWVVADGNLEFLPVENADADVLGPYAVTAGQIIPFQTRRVLEGTTATVVAMY